MIGEQVFEGYCVGGPQDGRRVKVRNDMFCALIHEPVEVRWPTTEVPPDAKVRVGIYRWSLSQGHWRYVGEQ